MRFANPENVARDLKKGMAEVEPLFAGFEEDTRLNLSGACGITSLALKRHIEHQGRKVETVLSEPALDEDPSFRHMFLRVDGATIVDAGYGVVLGLAGHTPGYVFYTGIDYYPQQPIAMFEVGHHQPLAIQMARTAAKFLSNYQKIPEIASEPAMIGKSEDEIVDAYERVWSPESFRPVELNAFYQQKGSELAEHLDPADAKLVA